MPKYYIPSPEEIRQTRRVADLTQAEAADECRITPTSWARYEQGHHAMPPSIWRLFNYVLEEQERDAKYSEPVEKPKKLTVYEMKQQREAEEQRKEMEAQRRRDERIQQRESKSVKTSWLSYNHSSTTIKTYYVSSSIQSTATLLNLRVIPC